MKKISALLLFMLLCSCSTMPLAPKNKFIGTWQEIKNGEVVSELIFTDKRCLIKEKDDQLDVSYSYTETDLTFDLYDAILDRMMQTIDEEYKSDKDILQQIKKETRKAVDTELNFKYVIEGNILKLENSEETTFFQKK